MSAEASGPPSADVPASLIEQRLDELTDLFRRRLLEDREKARAIAILQEQLQEARAGSRRQAIEPVVRQLLLVLDRLDTAGEERSELTDSIASQLLDILSQYGVHRLHVSGPFDPAIAEAWAVAPTENAHLDGHVATVERTGYAWADGVLRPAGVTIWRLQPPQ